MSQLEQLTGDGAPVRMPVTDVLPSDACAIHGATQQNTSPISALLRILATHDPLRSIEYTNRNRDKEAAPVDNKHYTMLQPLDDWISLPLEGGFANLRRSPLVSSPGFNDTLTSFCFSACFSVPFSCLSNVFLFLFTLFFS